jgi:hypothetical protein
MFTNLVLLTNFLAMERYTRMALTFWIDLPGNPAQRSDKSYCLDAVKAKVPVMLTV